VRQAACQLPPGRDTLGLDRTIALFGKLFRHTVERRG